MTTKKPTIETSTTEPVAKKSMPETAIRSETSEGQKQETPDCHKKSKHIKPKVIQDRFSFLKEEHQKLVALKKACIATGMDVKKGELIRAGLHLLTKLNQAELNQAVKQVERIKKS